MTTESLRRWFRAVVEYWHPTIDWARLDAQRSELDRLEEKNRQLRERIAERRGQLAALERSGIEAWIVVKMLGKVEA